jgi:hypothetical protein
MPKTDKMNENIVLRPHTIWDELAESDVLIEYLRHFQDSDINTNIPLRDELYQALYEHSSEEIPEVELYISQRYNTVLQHFLDKVLPIANNITSHKDRI